MKGHLQLESPCETDDTLIYTAFYHQIEGPPLPIRLEIPKGYSDLIGNPGNAMATLSIFTAMRAGGKFHVDAPMCPRLRKNLEEFSEAWSQWAPELYKTVEISSLADAVGKEDRTGGILVPFSGGLDSCHNMMKLLENRNGSSLSPKKLTALLVHGFDIPLEDKAAFITAEKNAREILDTVSVELLSISCSIRELPHHWENEHGAALAGCLHLFDQTFNQATIAGSHNYGTLRFPWGSNPLTDPLLSSRTLDIRYEGLAYSRNRKAKQLAAWPDAMNRLRPCWKPGSGGKNCGKCLRCLGTALSFASEGVPPPDVLNVGSLSRAVDILDTLKISITALNRLEDSILEPARANQINESWVAKLGKLIIRKQRRLQRKQLKHDLQKFICGALTDHK